LFISSSFNNPIVAKPKTKKIFVFKTKIYFLSLPEANSSGLACSVILVTVFDRIIFGSFSSLLLDND
jgi:hypothetical protein